MGCEQSGLAGSVVAVPNEHKDLINVCATVSSPTSLLTSPINTYGGQVFVNVTGRGGTDRALVDSGAARNLCSETWFTRQNLGNIEQENVLLTGITGKSLPVLFRANKVPFSIGEKQFESNFLVVRNLGNEIILGAEWLQNARITLDFKHMSLLGEGLEAPLIGITNRQTTPIYSVHLKQNIPN